MSTNTEAPTSTLTSTKITRPMPIKVIRLVFQIEDTPYNRQRLILAQSAAFRILGPVEGTLGITKREEVSVVSACNLPVAPLPTEDAFAKTPTLQQMREAGFTEAECHASLLKRLEGSINDWKGLLSEAYGRGDPIGVWEAGAHIRELERQRDTLRKP